MREAGLSPELLWDVIASARGCPARCCLGELICLLVAWHLPVCGESADGYLIAPSEDSVADLRRRGGEALVWSEGVVSHPVDGRREINEHRAAVTTLLALAQDAKCLVNGEHLDVEDFLVGTEVEAATSPATG